jgi:hypothetical protein
VFNLFFISIVLHTGAVFRPSFALNIPGKNCDVDEVDTILPEKVWIYTPPVVIPSAITAAPSIDVSEYTKDKRVISNQFLDPSEQVGDVMSL